MPSSARIFFLLLCVLLFETACSGHRQTTGPISLSARSKITQFNDTTFFSYIGTMTAAKSSMYVWGGKTNKLYHLNRRLKLLGTLGSTGKGPGEFTSLRDMSFVNDSLYAYDPAQAKILVYDNKNDFVRGIGLPDNSGWRMAVDSRSHIFLPTPDRSHPITELNAHGHIIRAFGQNTVGKNSFHFRRNLRMLIIQNNKLISVPLTEPFIKTYSLKGQLLYKTPIDRPDIHKLISLVQKQNGGNSASGVNIKKGNGSTHPQVHSLSPLFSDAAIHKNNLYLLVRAVWGKANLNKKFTLLLDYRLQNNGKVVYKRTFKLFRANHQHPLLGEKLIAPGDHTLIVFNETKSEEALLVFKDPQI
ncbi:MAG TPA: 6-bladed beta-propeller [Balneolaceae bacterium]|nr:6-bladed beta-propeller [Balneolaceae bacterium]